MTYLAIAWRWRYEILTLCFVFALSFAVDSCSEKDKQIKQLKTEHALELTTLRADYETRARKLEQANYEQVITAINDHKARQADDARAIASANTANERLSQTIDRLAANAATDADYRVEYAATTGELLKECSGSITKLAAAADGHVNDIKLLQDARRGVQ